MRHDAVGLPCQMSEHSSFDGREVPRLAGALEVATHEVDADLRESQLTRAGQRLLRVAAELLCCSAVNHKPRYRCKICGCALISSAGPSCTMCPLLMM